MFNILNNIKITHRLGIMVLTAVCCVVANGVLDTWQWRDRLYEEKHLKTRHLVEAVFGTREYFHEQQQQNLLSVEEAQAAALSVISRLRYGDGDYFWINDMDRRIVMHPMKPELNGKVSPIPTGSLFSMPSSTR